ncbi:hypothetical protein E5163_10720 [Marinicauda algicola]|uniref:ABC-type transport auxiliary lipoprotein component domain-containing protein n=1 Tax=Marinicauda algicola TaxID=2029849 RepID=A0A4V3RXY0_9PROT|nr:ABC-type transport auxiliary lipoprotein family protein [Marinicauda algicola]TGY88289.1 hypothetical protein E5163_10720 [Marinicauda algicola]
MSLSDLKRAGTALAAGLIVFGAPACVQLLPEQEPSTIFRLAPSVPEPGSVSAAAGQVILIERPQAPRALAGNRIATERGDGQLAYIAHATWISPAPDLVQELVLDTFDRELEGYAAARPADGVQSRYRLRTELRHFEAVYDQGGNRAPLAEVVLRARLVDEETRELLAVTTVRGEARAGANRQGEIVDAMGEAARAAAGELAAWAQTVLGEDA